MKKLRIMKQVLVYTKAHKVLITYLIFIVIDAFIIFLAEPDIHTWREALWYCYAVLSTAGFGDVVAATFIGRAASVLLTAYSLIAIGIVTGVIVNYYNQIIQIRQKETITAFLDRLEHLPELSRKELEEMSENVIHFRSDYKDN